MRSDGGWLVAPMGGSPPVTNPSLCDTPLRRNLWVPFLENGGELLRSNLTPTVTSDRYVGMRGKCKRVLFRRSVKKVKREKKELKPVRSLLHEC